MIILTLLFFGCSQDMVNDENTSEEMVFDKEQIPQGSSKLFDYNGKEAIIINHEGNFYAFYKSCPIHPNLDVEYANGKLICPHGEFSMEGIAKNWLPLRIGEDMKQINLIVDENKIIIK